MGTKKARKNCYQKHTYIASKKRWKKIVWKKCENTFFINTRISRPKNGGKKREEKIVQKHTNRLSKNFWKIIVWKKCEITFFINNEYRDEKSGGKNARKIFSKNTRIGYPKIVGKKSSGKSVKIRFL